MGRAHDDHDLRGARLDGRHRGGDPGGGDEGEGDGSGELAQRMLRMRTRGAP